MRCFMSNKIYLVGFLTYYEQNTLTAKVLAAALKNFVSFFIHKRLFNSTSYLLIDQSNLQF